MKMFTLLLFYFFSINTTAGIQLESCENITKKPKQICGTKSVNTYQASENLTEKLVNQGYTIDGSVITESAQLINCKQNDTKLATIACLDPSKLNQKGNITKFVEDLF